MSDASHLMNDMSVAIIPRSDQINADSLLAGPITITITEVDIRPGQEQPVSIFYEGGKPWKPCKSMARALVHCWGRDANQYVGRSLTLYCDPKVTWGGLAVGGIRISHMSHIKSAVTIVLTATKGNKKPFVIKPLVVDVAPPAVTTAGDAEPPVSPPKKPTVRDVVRERLAAATTAEEVHAVSDIPAVKRALVEAPEDIREEIGAMIAAALERVSGGETDETVV